MIFSAGDDDVVWKPSRKKYVTADGINVLRTLSLGNQVGVQGKWSTIWILKIPPKFQIFLWKMEHGVLPTRSFLSTRLGSLVTDLYCKMCCLCIEDQNHIFWEFFLQRIFGNGFLNGGGLAICSVILCISIYGLG